MSGQPMSSGLSPGEQRVIAALEEYLATLGLARLRLGDADSARGAIRRSMALNGGAEAHDWLVLALVEQTQGHREAARNWLRKGRPAAESESAEPGLASLLGEAIRRIETPGNAGAGRPR